MRRFFSPLSKGLCDDGSATCGIFFRLKLSPTALTLLLFSLFVIVGDWLFVKEKGEEVQKAGHAERIGHRRARVDKNTRGWMAAWIDQSTAKQASAGGGIDRKSPEAYGFQVDLPLEYRGGEVEEAEEVLYEDGSIELQCVMNVGLGQEKILVVEKFTPDGNRRYASVFSAERLSVYASPGYYEYTKTALAAAGFEVMENRYGAKTLSLRMRTEAGEGFFKAKLLLEQIVGGAGEIFLNVANGRDASIIAEM